MLAGDGKLILGTDNLYFLVPRAQCSWKLQLTQIQQHTRHAPQSTSIFGSGTGGKLEILAKIEAVVHGDAVWTCQVCEEVNQGSGAKCNICGSKQIGDLQLVEAEVKADEEAWACEVCEEFNTGSALKCKACGFSRPKRTDTPTKAPSQIPKQEQMKIFLHFTKGGSAAFHEKLTQVLETLQSKPIEQKAIGIAGLMNLQENKAKETSETIDTAFTDLDSLIHRAGVLLKLAQQLAVKATTEADSEGRATLKDLLSLIGNENVDAGNGDFYSSLAAKISRICTALQQKTGNGVHSLADVYLLYCRSGEALIAPGDLRRAAETMRSSWTLKRVSETLCLVQSQAVTKIRERLEALLKTDQNNCLTPLQWSKEANLSLFMAAEELKMAETEGWLVKDSKRPGMTTAYYWNIFIK